MGGPSAHRQRIEDPPTHAHRLPASPTAEENRPPMDTPTVPTPPPPPANADRVVVDEVARFAEFLRDPDPDRVAAYRRHYGPQEPRP